MPRDAPSAAADTGADEAEVGYYCVRCGALVTQGRWRLAMGGDHEHVVFNPAGILFRILCFKEAPGVSPVGPPSGEFTWFRGYQWRLAPCASCATHLGWLYQGDGMRPAVFFGLIKPRLRRGAAP
jgi:hypothetical protein